MDQFQWLRKTILKYQVQLIKNELNEQEQINKQNVIRNEATKLLLNYLPESTYLQLYNSDIIAPNGVFEPTVNLVARIKVELSKRSPIFRESQSSMAGSSTSQNPNLHTYENPNNITSPITTQNTQKPSNHNNSPPHKTESQQIISDNTPQLHTDPNNDSITDRINPQNNIQSSPQWHLSANNSTYQNSYNDSVQISQDQSQYQKQLREKLMNAKNEEQQQQLNVLKNNSQHLSQQIQSKQDNLQQLEEQIEKQNEEIKQLKESVESQLNVLQVLNKDVTEKENAKTNNYQLIKQLKDIQLFIQAKIKLITELQNLYNQTTNDTVLVLLQNARNQQVDKLQLKPKDPQQNSNIPSSLNNLKNYLNSDKKNVKSLNKTNVQSNSENNLSLSQTNQKDHHTNVNQNLEINQQQNNSFQLNSFQTSKVDDDLEQLLSQNLTSQKNSTINQKNKIQNDAGNVSNLSDQNFAGSKLQVPKPQFSTPLPRQTNTKQSLYQNTIRTPQKGSTNQSVQKQNESKSVQQKKESQQNLNKNTQQGQQKLCDLPKPTNDKAQQSSFSYNRINNKNQQNKPFNYSYGQHKSPVKMKIIESENDKNSLIEDINNFQKKGYTWQPDQLSQQLSATKQGSKINYPRSVSNNTSQFQRQQQDKIQNKLSNDKDNSLSINYKKQLEEMSQSLKKSQVNDQSEDIKQKKKIDLDAYRKMIQQRARETQKKEERIQQMRQHETMTEQLYKQRDQRIEQFAQRQRQKELSGEIYVNRLVYDPPSPNYSQSYKDKQALTKIKEQKANGLENLKFAKNTGQVQQKEEHHETMQQSSFISDRFEQPELVNYSNINMKENPPVQNEENQVIKESEDPVTKLDRIFDELDRDIFG